MAFVSDAESSRVRLSFGLPTGSAADASRACVACSGVLGRRITGDVLWPLDRGTDSGSCSSRDRSPDFRCPLFNSSSSTVLSRDLLRVCDLVCDCDLSFFVSCPLSSKHAASVILPRDSSSWFLSPFSSAGFGCTLDPSCVLLSSFALDIEALRSCSRTGFSDVSAPASGSLSGSVAMVCGLRICL